MFFFRQWRKRVEGLEKGLAVLEAQRREFERALHSEAERFNNLLALYTEQQRSFQKLADQYTEGLQRSREIIDDLQRQPPVPEMRSQPLHMTEIEEDLKFAFDSGALDQEDYNQALRDAGLAD